VARNITLAQISGARRRRKQLAQFGERKFASIQVGSILPHFRAKT
jgi:hypothetical protein